MLYKYERVCHDERVIDLQTNGLIGIGAGAREHHWRHVDDELVIFGSDGKPTCRLKQMSYGWVGRWLMFERMAILLTPMRSYEFKPSRHAGSYQFRQLPRACFNVSFEIRQMVFEPDGKISGMVNFNFCRWVVETTSDQEVLTILNEQNYPSMHLTQNAGDGIWRGRYIEGNQCPVALVRCV